jgi:chemotaxis protein CheX
MNAEVVNKFLGATTTVLAEYFNINIFPGGTPLAVPPSSAMEPVTVVLEMNGDLMGQFLLGCTHEVALEIARAMMSNPEWPEFDDMCRSALAELGNMIAGTASTRLSEIGMLVDLTPPLVVTGSNISIHFSVPVILSVPVKTSVGELRVFIALKPGPAK